MNGFSALRATLIGATSRSTSRSFWSSALVLPLQLSTVPPEVSACATHPSSRTPAWPAASEYNPAAVMQGNSSFSAREAAVCVFASRVA